LPSESERGGSGVAELAVLLTFISVGSLFYSLSANWNARNRQIKTRLERLKPALPLYNHIDNELDKPFLLRVCGPVLQKLSKVSFQLTPVNIRIQSEQLLDLAGRPWNLSVKEFLVFKFILIIFLPGIVLLMTFRSNPLLTFVAVVTAFLITMVLPNFVLKRAITMRQQKITDELPDNLDLLTVSVEAGLGFDQALLKVVEKSKGVLPQEFQRVLHEIRIGKTRRDALREMASRTGVEDLQTFVAAIIQADQLGVSIGNVLRIQSQQLRQKRRMNAEERAQKAPIKMLIPMVLFIFPSLFIILLGPGVLQMIDQFLKMEK
jgi:tight adherence protein C